MNKTRTRWEILILDVVIISMITILCIDFNSYNPLFLLFLVFMTGGYNVKVET